MEPQPRPHVFAGEQSAVHTVRRAARQGDRARRAQRGAFRVARLVPVVTAAALLAAAAAAFAGSPRVVVPLVIGLGAAVAAVMIIDTRRRRVVSDPVAAMLDRAAGLDGVLRSAHWFANAPPWDAEALGERDASWRAFHVGQAAERCEHVDWPAVFGQRPRRRVWVTGIAGTCAALALSMWFLPLAPAGPGATADAADAFSIDEPPGSMSATVAARLVEGVRAMQEGRTPSREALAAIGQVLDSGRDDPAGDQQAAVLAQLNRDLAEARTGAGGMLEGGERWGDEDLYGFDINSTRLEWIYQEAMARAALAQRESPDPSTPGTAPDASIDGQGGDPATAGAAGDEAMKGAPVLADVGGTAASFSALLFGRQQATGGGAPAADAAQVAARRAALSVALRNEVVHASVDVAGPGLERSGRRRATNAASDGAVTPGAGLPSYDRASATRAPAIPEARRTLVRGYFHRAAGPEPSREP